LVFYNHLLKCFVLFDLKSGELTHQDIGQMDMYVRMYDELRVELEREQQWLAMQREAANNPPHGEREPMKRKGIILASGSGTPQTSPAA